jgi:hypothetical protein
MEGTFEFGEFDEDARMHQQMQGGDTVRFCWLNSKNSLNSDVLCDVGKRKAPPDL